MINPQPSLNCGLLWFIIPLNANVNGNGCNFFSKTAPTVQFVSTLPINKNACIIENNFENKLRMNTINNTINNLSATSKY